jgi:hypothetical protein
MLQMYTALPHLSTLCFKVTLTLLAVYLPGGPFMIMSMMGRGEASCGEAEGRGGGGGPRVPRH